MAVEDRDNIARPLLEVQQSIQRIMVHEQIKYKSKLAAAGFFRLQNKAQFDQPSFSIDSSLTVWVTVAVEVPRSEGLQKYTMKKTRTIRCPDEITRDDSIRS